MSDIRTRAIKALEGARFEDEAQREKVIKQIEDALREVKCETYNDCFNAIKKVFNYPDNAAAIRARSEA